MKGIISIEKVRPPGYEYPVGLTPVSNVAATTTGGTSINFDISGPVKYAIHTFRANGTFTPSFTGIFEYLVVGGGGAGAGGIGGGGGAGGFVPGKIQIAASTGSYCFNRKRRRWFSTIRK